MRYSSGSESASPDEELKEKKYDLVNFHTIVQALLRIRDTWTRALNLPHATHRNLTDQSKEVSSRFERAMLNGASWL